MTKTTSQPDGNLFESISDSLPEEIVTVLANHGDVRIERIVSTGHRSPQDFWYDQEEHEWVLVLKGEARLKLENVADSVTLSVGDYFHIAAGRRHRVEWTSSDEPTIWLAVFYR